MNKWIGKGFVGRDPELKMTPSGQTLCRFSIATTERWVKDGEKKEKTEWHNIVAWGKQAEVIEKHVKKGQELLIEGKIEYTTYADKDNPDKKLYGTHIRLDRFEFCGKSGDGGSSRPDPEPSGYAAEPSSNGTSGGNYDEDIPF